MVNTRTVADLAAAVQNALQTLLPQIRAEIREEFRTSSGPLDAGGNPPPNWISHIEKIFDVMGCEDAFKTRLAVYKFEGNALAWWKAYKQAKGGDAWLERLKREYHSIRQTNTETSTEFMQRFLRLAGFIGAAAGTEEEQAKNFQWGLRRSTLNHLMCMSYMDVAQMVNTRTDADVSAAVQNALQNLLPQIRAEIREEFRTSSGPSDAGGNPPLLPQIREEIREEFRTGSGSSNAGGNPPPVTIHTWLERFNKQKPHSLEKATAPVIGSLTWRRSSMLWIVKMLLRPDWLYISLRVMHWLGGKPISRPRVERLKREYHSIRQTSTETSTEFMQCFLQLTGFLGAAAGTEEEQAKNFQWGLRRNFGNGRDQRNRGQQSNRSVNSGNSL
nr:hypothetical protein [Tanacetum cinerariifolium]